MITLQDTVREMKRMGELLIPYTIPKVSLEDENRIKILKQRNITVDGYDIIVSYSKSEYKDHLLEIVQIQSEFVPFLPFNVVCKIAKAFLGSDCLSFIDFVKIDRKLYCWILQRSKNGDCILSADSKSRSFDGFEFYSMNPNAVNFY